MRSSSEAVGAPLLGSVNTAPGAPASKGAGVLGSVVNVRAFGVSSLDGSNLFYIARNGARILLRPSLPDLILFQTNTIIGARPGLTRLFFSRLVQEPGCWPFPLVYDKAM